MDHAEMSDTKKAALPRTNQTVKANSLVAELFLNGYSTHEIAMECGVSLHEIRQQCDLIVAQWEKLMASDPRRAELRSIHSLERLYRRMAQSIIFEKEPSANNELATTEYSAKQRTTRSTESLDIKPLQGIERCIELRMKLLNAIPTPEVTQTRQEQLNVNLSKLARETLLELLEACK